MYPNYGYAPMTYQGAPPVMYQGAGFGRTVSERIDRLVQRGQVLEVGQTATKPNIPELSIQEAEARFYPWYKRWWVWASLGGLVVAGGTTLFLAKRKK